MYSVGLDYHQNRSSLEILDAQGARFKARHVKQIPHEHVEVICFVIDRGEELNARLRIPAYGACSQTRGRRLDRSQRRAQVMRNRREQRRLEVIALL